MALGQPYRELGSFWKLGYLAGVVVLNPPGSFDTRDDGGGVGRSDVHGPDHAGPAPERPVQAQQIHSSNRPPAACRMVGGPRHPVRNLTVPSFPARFFKSDDAQVKFCKALG